MIENCDIELIQELTNHYIETYDLPPLAAKIYAYLLMDCRREGVTFDEIIEIFNVSKSSVSNSLQLLIQNKYVEQFSKINQRKRFYRLSSGNILLRLNHIHDMLQKEKAISRKMYNYYEKNDKIETKIFLKKMKIYLNHLDTSVEKLSQTINLLENKA